MLFQKPKKDAILVTIAATLLTVGMGWVAYYTYQVRSNPVEPYYTCMAKHYYRVDENRVMWPQVKDGKVMECKSPNDY